MYPVSAVCGATGVPRYVKNLIHSGVNYVMFTVIMNAELWSAVLLQRFPCHVFRMPYPRMKHVRMLYNMPAVASGFICRLQQTYRHIRTGICLATYKIPPHSPAAQ